MTTATKRSPKAATKNRRKQPAARTLKKQTVEPMDIPVGQIAPSPFQPRQDFASAEIDALAKSIEAVGQVQPITVRPMSAGYELIDGERRWRAVKALGHKTIRAEVAEHTDAQVRAMVLASAMQRQDLNPIEEARAFRQMIDAGDAKGPTALAKLVLKQA